MEEYATPDDFEAKESRNGLKSRFERFLNGPYFIVCIIILVAISSFCIGKFWGFNNNREQVRLIDNSSQIIESPKTTAVPSSKSSTKTQTQTATVVNTVVSDDTEVVGSKNGTKYHLPTCPGAKQISEANKITFPSISSARSAGYTPALNCKGLK